MRIVTVNNKFDNKHLNSFLMNEFSGLTQNTFYKALRKKDIRVNDIKVSENVIVHEGDKITIYILDNFLFNKSSKINVIYEDENILIVNKPKNIEVTGKDSLTSFISKKYGENVMPCHRLDRNTEGLVLFAKSETALNIISEKFKNQEITKYYKCKVIRYFKEKT